MTELNSKIKPIENTFILLEKSNQLESFASSNPAVKSMNQKFETVTEKFNVEFEKIPGQHHYTSYNISVKDEAKKDLFKVIVIWSQPLFEVPSSTIYMQVQGQTIQDNEQINTVLNSSSFDKILENINIQSKDIIKEQERVALLPAKTTSELVSDILVKINKIRPDLSSSTDAFYGFKD